LIEDYNLSLSVLEGTKEWRSRGWKVRMDSPSGKDDTKGYEEDNSNKYHAAKYVTIKEVHNLLLKEVQMPTLQSIPLDTYKTIAATLEKLKEQEYDGLETNLRDRIVELISLSMGLLLNIRYHKLLEQHVGANDENGWSSSLRSKILSAAEYSKLTDEEKYIFDAEMQINLRKMAILGATLRGRPKALESISGRILLKRMVLRFVKPMEQFIGMDMRRYGPFHEEDVAVIPFENARSLMENGIAVQFDIQLND
jgi:DNA replication factor GINS